MFGGRRDGRCYSDEARLAKKRGNVRNTPQIFRSIGFAEAEVGVQSGSQHVTIEQE